MKFGRVDNPGIIDFTLPDDHPETLQTIKKFSSTTNNIKPEIFVGCAKWNRKELKGFYPKGTKDELTYYSQQFNAIEFNATFYSKWDFSQMEKWANKTPFEFKFFPKVPQSISHARRLKDTEKLVDDFCYNITGFGSKLGMLFLQLNNNFGTKNYDTLKAFVDKFPKEIPLAIELRNTDWFNDKANNSKLYKLFEENKITNIITDTAGRRDLLHMRLTSDASFIRYVGANDKSDYSRLDDWVKRLQHWHKNGLNKIYFFVHQHDELESPALVAYFISKLNSVLKTKLKVPIV